VFAPGLPIHAANRELRVDVAFGGAFELDGETLPALIERLVHIHLGR
jgi:hypothetical protein